MDARYPIHVTYHKARKGNANKMEGMVSINADTYNNPFCKNMCLIKGSVCERCYAMKLSAYYGPKSTAPFERNSRLLNDELEEWQIPRLNAAYCRFHSFGELESDLHYYNLVRIAKANPDTHFALWTKRPDLVTRQLTPSNLVLVYSTLMVNGVGAIPKGFHKSFVVRDDGRDLNCEESCFACLKCYRRDGEAFIKERLR